MKSNALHFGDVMERIKTTWRLAEARGFEPNLKFLSWGGTMEPRAYLRRLLLLYAMSLLIGFVVIGFALPMATPAASVSNALQALESDVGGGDSLPMALGRGLGTSLWMGFSWLSMVVQFVVMAILSVVYSVLLVSLMDRRLRDLRRTQEWHIEILLFAFVLSLVPFLGWIIFLMALLLAFVPSEAFSMSEKTSCPGERPSSTDQAQVSALKH